MSIDCPRPTFPTSSEAIPKGRMSIPKNLKQTTEVMTRHEGILAARRPVPARREARQNA